MNINRKGVWVVLIVFAVILALVWGYQAHRETIPEDQWLDRDVAENINAVWARVEQNQQWFETAMEESAVLTHQELSLAETLVALTRGFSLKGESIGAYNRLKNNRKRLEFLLEHGFEANAEHAVLRSLYSQYILPFENERIESLQIGGEHAGSDVLRGLYRDAVTAGKRRELTSGFFVANVGALGELNEKTARWLGVYKATTDLSRAYKEILVKNEKRLEKIEKLLPGLEDKNYSEIKKLSKDSPEHVAFDKLRKKVLYESDRIYGSGDMAGALASTMRLIKERLLQRRLNLGGLHDPSESFYEAFRPLGELARQTTDLYGLTESQRDAPLAIKQHSAKDVALFSRLVLDGGFNYTGRAGWIQETRCRIEHEDGRFVPVRRCHYRLVWREKLNAETVLHGAEQKTLEHFLEIEPGILLFESDTRLARGPHNVPELAPVRLDSGRLRVELDRVNAMLGKLELPTYLEAVSAVAAFDGKDLLLRISFAVPSLSGEVTHELEVNLDPTKGPIKPRFSEKIHGLIQSLVLSLDQRLQKQGSAFLFAGQPPPSLGDAVHADITALRLGPGSPTQIEIDHSAKLLDLTLPIKQRFIFEGAQLVPMAAVVDPLIFRTAMILNLSEPNLTSSRIVAYQQAAESLHHELSLASAVSRELAEPFVDGLIQQIAFFQEETLATHVEPKIRETILHAFDENPLAGLGDIPLPAKTWWLLYQELGVFAEIEKAQVPLGRNLTRTEAWRFFRDLTPETYPETDFEYRQRLLPGQIKNACLQMVHDILAKGLSAVAETLALEEASSDAAIFYANKLQRHWPSWEAWFDDLTKSGIQLFTARTRLMGLVDQTFLDSVQVDALDIKVDSDNHINTKVTLFPTALLSVWPILSIDNQAMLGRTAVLEPARREEFSHALQLARRVGMVLDHYRTEIKRLNRRSREEWVTACQGLTARDDLKQTLAGFVVSEFGLVVDNAGVRIVHDSQGFMDNGWIAGGALALLLDEDHARFTAPLEAFRGYEAQFWVSERVRLGEFAKNLVERIGKDPEVLRMMEDLNKIRGGKSYGEIVGEGGALPATVPLFGEDRPLYYRFDQGRLAVSASVSDQNPLGRPFEIVDGLRLEWLDDAKPDIAVSWESLQTEPSFVRMAADFIQEKYPVLDITAISNGQGVAGLSLEWVPNGLNLPVHASVFFDANTMESDQNLLKTVAIALKNGLREKLAEGALPGWGPFQLNYIGEPVNCDDPLGLVFRGVLTLGGVPIEIGMEICPGRKYRLEIDAKSIPLDGIPQIKGLDVSLSAEYKPRAETDGGLRIYFKLKVVAQLPGAKAYLNARFMLDRDGFHFQDDIVLYMPGWWDTDDFALGDLWLKLEPHTKTFHLKGSLTLTPGEETSRYVKVTLAGKFKVGDPEYFFAGDLFVLKTNVADVSVKLSIPDETVIVKLNSTILPQFLFELKGELILKNAVADDQPSIFFKLEGELFGLDLFKAGAELTKKNAGRVWAEIDDPFSDDRDRLTVYFQEDFSDPGAKYAKKTRISGLSIEFSADANSRRVVVAAKAEVASIPVEASVTLPNLATVPIDEIIKRLLDLSLNLNLPSSLKIDLGSEGSEGDGKEGDSDIVGTGGGVTSSSDGSPAQTPGKFPWYLGWKDVKKVYIKKSLFGLIKEKRVRWEPEYKGLAGTLFGRLGISKKKVKSGNGYYKVKGSYGLIRKKDGWVGLLQKNAVWRNTGWHCRFTQYGRGGPQGDDLWVLKHRNHKNKNLAILHYQGRFYAALSGADIHAPGPKVKDISADMRKLETFDPTLLAEVAWYIGYFHHVNGSEPVIEERENVVFMFLDGEQIALTPREGGVSLITFALLGGRNSGSLPEEANAKYLKALERLNDLPLGDPPGPALLVVGPERGMLCFREPRSEEGRLVLLYGDGQSTEGNWQWLDRPPDDELDAFFHGLEDRRLELIKSLISGFPEGIVSPHLSFRYWAGHEHKALRMAVIGADGEFGFGGERISLGDQATIRWLTWKTVGEHWSKHLEYMAKPKLPTPRVYGELLINNSWEKDGWKSDPAGPWFPK